MAEPFLHIMHSYTVMLDNHNYVNNYILEYSQNRSGYLTRLIAKYLNSYCIYGTLNVLCFAEFKVLFESVSIEAAEGESGVEVCLRLGGTDWLVLERHLIFELESDGGIIIVGLVSVEKSQLLLLL